MPVAIQVGHTYQGLRVLGRGPDRSGSTTWWVRDGSGREHATYGSYLSTDAADPARQDRADEICCPCLRCIQARALAAAAPRERQASPVKVLNEDAVLAIRERAAAGERYRDIATDFGLDQAQVSGIARGRLRPEVGGPRTRRRRGRGAAA